MRFFLKKEKIEFFKVKRSEYITNIFIEKEVLVSNGKNFINIKITKNMLMTKFGCYAITKLKGSNIHKNFFLRLQKKRQLKLLGKKKQKKLDDLKICKKFNICKVKNLRTVCLAL